MLRQILITIVLLIFLSLPTAVLFHQIIMVTNPDLGLHLKLGEIIVSQKHIPLINLFSYTYPEFQYVNLAWLSQAIFFLIYTLFTANGLIYLHTIVIVIALIIPIVFCLRKNNVGAIGVVIFLSSIILLGRPDIRPEMFSFLFLSTLITILFIYKERFTKWLFFLIPLQILWVNMHLYFILGLIIIWIFFIDQYIQKNPQVKIVFFVAIVSTIASLCNPYGLTGLLHPLMVFNNYGFPVDENNNIFYNPYSFHRVNIFFYWLYVLFLLTVQFLNRKQTSLFAWFLTIFFSLAGIFVQRLIPLIIFATFIPFVQGLSFVGNNLSTYFTKNDKQRKKLHTFQLFFIMLLFLFVIAKIIALPGFGLGIQDQGKPATKFFLENSLQGPIFNNYDIGNYLDFRLYPKEKVFVDGRPEAYPADFFQNTYFLMLKNSEIFANIDKKYNFNTIVISHQDKAEETGIFLQQIVNNPNWKLVYLDDIMIILVKNNDKNRSIISKFAMTQQNIHIHNFDSLDTDGLSRIGVFFMKMGWTDNEEELAKEILKRYPYSCPALGRLITINIQKDIPANQIYIDTYNNHCR